jgi:hypothetical protein
MEAEACRVRGNKLRAGLNVFSAVKMSVDSRAARR